MEIRFSKDRLCTGEPFMGGPPLQFRPQGAVVAIVHKHRLELEISSVRDRDVRFRLVSSLQLLAPASTNDHDRVIRALLQLDPDATIRTARACYEGLRDFEAQLSVRGK